MDILLCLFLICLLYKIQIKGEREYLSLEYTTYLKGILALVIVLGHIQFDRINLAIFKVFNYSGNFAVALFFFLSGYGLLSQYVKKKKEYLKGFFTKRILKLVIIYFIFNVIYSVAYFAIGHLKSVDDIVKLLVQQQLLVAHSWYIIDILILYLLFWISATIFGEAYQKIVASVFAFSVVVFFSFLTLGYSEYWYATIFAFAFGMEYRIIEEQVNKISDKMICLITTIGIAVFCGIYIIVGQVLDTELQTYVLPLIMNIICICVAFMVVNLGKFIQFRNPFFKICGEISLELYLIHGLFEKVLSNVNIVAGNDLVYGILVLGLSIFTAYIIHHILNRSFVRKSVN